MSVERTWDRVFRRSLEAAEANNTDVNDELEKEWPGGKGWVDAYITPHIPAHGVVCEIGAGSGRITKWVEPRAEQIYLTDYSEYACGLLREKFPKAQVLHVNDCRLDGIQDESLDLVYSVSVFGHLYEEQVYCYFRESFIKLKSGGMISIHLTDIRDDMDHFVRNIPEKVDSWKNVFRYLHPDYATTFAKHIGFNDVRIDRADRGRAYFLRAVKPS